ncbi:MAG TPA: hypothetical protein VL967_02225 [Terracidiphilus sp.]|nr:hypothetical protein [Terracidiphilus sp.]
MPQRTDQTGLLGQREEVNRAAHQRRILIAIKLLHTAIWVVLSGCILAIPMAAALQRFRTAGSLFAIVLVECAILAFNRGRCPLTGLAARYTEERRANLDIYLPLWLARYNKVLFGFLFVAGALFALLQWRLSLR